MKNNFSSPLSQLLCCPICQKKLDEQLFCKGCNRHYKNEKGIMILITKELEDELNKRKN